MSEKRVGETRSRRGDAGTRRRGDAENGNPNQNFVHPIRIDTPRPKGYCWRIRGVTPHLTIFPYPTQCRDAPWRVSTLQDK
ncbi:MAG: hypothetical protein F6K41_08690 [Symploca sp. SIO3E6]|nr:hypothetical protein [Caldora sp. SIO3E6]